MRRGSHWIASCAWFGLTLAAAAHGSECRPWPFSLAGPSWQAAAPLPEPREDAGGVEGGDGRLYLYGGHPSDLLTYSPREDRWATGSSSCVDPLEFVLQRWQEASRKQSAYPQERDSRCEPGASWGGAVPGSAVSDPAGRPLWISQGGVRAFDWATDRWVGLPHGREHRELATQEGSDAWFSHKDGAYARAPDGRIFAIGGEGERVGPRHQRLRDFKQKYSPDSGSLYAPHSGSRNPAAVETYDPVTGIWTAVAPLRIGRVSSAAAFGADGKLYVFGGIYAATHYNTVSHERDSVLIAEQRALETRLRLDRWYPLSSVEVYDPATDEWELRTRMPYPRDHASAALGADGRIYVLGCPVAWSVLYPQEPCVQVYDPSSDSWETGPQLRTPRHAVAAIATRDGRIYAIAGSTSRLGLTLWSFLHGQGEVRGEKVSDVEFLEPCTSAPHEPPAEVPSLRRNRKALEAALARLAGAPEPPNAIAMRDVELYVTPRDADALAPITAQLGSPEWLVRRSALRALARMHATARPMAAKIAPLLDDDVTWVRWQAFETLLALGADARPAVPMLIAALRSPDFNDRVRASAALGKVGADAVPALERELRDPSHPYPWECAEALREIGAPAIPALERALALDDREIRKSALFALAVTRTASPSAVKAVGVLLASSDDWLLDWLAVYALSRLGPEGDEALFRALDDPRSTVALSSAWALADAHPGSARVRSELEALLRATAANDERRREVYEAALAKLTSTASPETPSAPAAVH